MELHNIEKLLESYFEGTTTIAEENQLRDYFSSSDVAQHLQQYKPLFSYFSDAGNERSTRQIPLQTKKRKTVAWLSAASVVILLSVGFAWFSSTTKENLGTFDNPETAFRETQKALNMLSGNVNKGIVSMRYVKEYENTKNQVFQKD